MKESSAQLAAEIESCRNRLADGRDPAGILLDLYGILSRAPADTSAHHAGLGLLAALCDQQEQQLFAHGLRLQMLWLQHRMADERIVAPPDWSLARYSVMLLCHTVGLPLVTELENQRLIGYGLSRHGATGARLDSMSWRAPVAIPGENAGALIKTDIVTTIVDLRSEAARVLFQGLSIGSPLRLSEHIEGTLLIAASVVSNFGVAVSVRSEDFPDVAASSNRMINGQLPLELYAHTPSGNDPLDWVGAATLQRLRGAMLFAIQLYSRSCALFSEAGDKDRQSETYFEIAESYLEMGYVAEAEMMYRHLQKSIAPPKLVSALADRWRKLSGGACIIPGTKVPETPSDIGILSRMWSLLERSNDNRRISEFSRIRNLFRTRRARVSAIAEVPVIDPEIVRSPTDAVPLLPPEIVRSAGYRFDSSTGKILGGSLAEEALAEFEAGKALNQAWKAEFPDEDSPFAVPLAVNIFEADIPELGNPGKLRRLKMGTLTSHLKEPPFTRLNRYRQLPNSTTSDDAAKRFAGRIGAAVRVMHFRLCGSFSTEFGSSISPGNVSVSGGVYDYETVQLPGHSHRIEEFQRQDLINAIRVIQDFFERSGRTAPITQMLLTFYGALTRRTAPSMEFSGLLEKLDNAGAGVLDGHGYTEWVECLLADADLTPVGISDDSSARAETGDSGALTQERLAVLVKQALSEDEPAHHLLAIALQQSKPEKAILRIASILGATAAEATNEAAAKKAKIDAKAAEMTAAQKGGETERVIELASELLTLISKQSEPVRWAALHSILATHLVQLSGSGHAQNVERAINHLHQALEVRTREAVPVRWADTHANLATTYYIRIRGDRQNNLEVGIRHLEFALEVFTRDAHARQWGEAQIALGNLYYDRPAGNRIRNLETAIESYKLALEVLRRQDTPVVWANAHSNLANAYFRRMVGDRRENVSRAIDHGRLALEIRRRETFLGAWAKSTRNLASFYRSKSEWGGRDDLLTAISLYYQILDACPRNEDPGIWAILRDELSVALSSIPFSDVAGSIPWKTRRLL